MIDLSSYDVEVKKVLTRKEFDERTEKGIIKSGDIVEVYDYYGNVTRIQYIEIPPPGWVETIKELKKCNWQDKEEIKSIYKKQKDFWNAMKEGNIIPKDIVNEIESEEQNGKWKIQ